MLTRDFVWGFALGFGFDFGSGLGFRYGFWISLVVSDLNLKLGCGFLFWNLISVKVWLGFLTWMLNVDLDLDLMLICDLAFWV